MPDYHSHNARHRLLSDRRKSAQSAPAGGALPADAPTPRTEQPASSAAAPAVDIHSDGRVDILTHDETTEAHRLSTAERMKLSRRVRDLTKMVQGFATVGRANAGQVAELQAENVCLQGPVEDLQRQVQQVRPWRSEGLDIKLSFDPSLSGSARHIELSRL